jgi:hypothetical protein
MSTSLHPTAARGRDEKRVVGIVATSQSERPRRPAHTWPAEVYAKYSLHERRRRAPDRSGYGNAVPNRETTTMAGSDRMRFAMVANTVQQVRTSSSPSTREKRNRRGNLGGLRRDELSSEPSVNARLTPLRDGFTRSLGRSRPAFASRESLTDILSHLGKPIRQPVEHAKPILVGELPGDARKDVKALFDDLPCGLAVGQHERGWPNDVEGRAGGRTWTGRAHGHFRQNWRQ